MLVEIANCLYRFLDCKKLASSDFPLLSVHRNIKRKWFFNSRVGFFRKSQFSTFSSINPGFGEPWDMLWKFFHLIIFILLQKNSFGQKELDFMHGLKSAILATFQKGPGPRDSRAPLVRPSRIPRRIFKKSFWFGFLWIPSDCGRLILLC